MFILNKNINQLIITSILFTFIISCKRNEKCIDVEDHNTLCIDYKRMPNGSSEDTSIALRIKYIVPNSSNSEDIITLKNYSLTTLNTSEFLLKISNTKYNLSDFLVTENIGFCQEKILFLGDTILNNSEGKISLIKYDVFKDKENIIQEINYSNISLNDTISYELGD